VMFAMVDLHGTGIDVGLERIVRITQLGKIERIGHVSRLLGIVVVSQEIVPRSVPLSKPLEIGSIGAGILNLKAHPPRRL